MKILALIFYISGLILLLVSVFPVSGITDKVSEKALSGAGINKGAIDSTDAKIDNILYKIKLAEQQIAQFKNFFSGGAEEGQKPAQESNRIIGRNLYDPLLHFMSQIIRGAGFLLSLVLISFGTIAHLISRNLTLRNRVERLEKTVYG